MSGGAHAEGTLGEYCERFQSLHTGHDQGRLRPHKAVMLLAVLWLADSGQLVENKEAYGPELPELFKRFFALVCGPTDQCTPWNPFFYLRGDNFWHLQAQAGQEATLAAMRNPGGAGLLMASVAYASPDKDLFQWVAQADARGGLPARVLAGDGTPR